jgi:hypothetical protein
VGEVERLIERDLAAPGARQRGIRPDLSRSSINGFEDRFRGSREDITARLADCALRGRVGRTRLGCGRGEFSGCCDRTATARGLVSI